MSDSDAPEPPKPPAAKPSAKTSTVPLKKETVRITLRAKHGGGVTQPKKATAPAPTVSAEPKAPAPPAPPTASGAPAPPAPPAPAAGGPPAPPSPGGAPGMKKTQKVTVKAAPSPAPAAPAPAAAPSPVPASPAPAAPAPAKTVPLSQPKTAATPAGTQALPKATVKLQQTQPLASGPAATGNLGSTTAEVSADSQLLLEDDEPTGFLPFAVILGILSLVAMALAILTSDKLMKRPIGATDGFAVPHPVNPNWEKSDGQGGFVDRFTLPEIPEYTR